MLITVIALLGVYNLRQRSFLNGISARDSIQNEKELSSVHRLPVLGVAARYLPRRCALQNALTMFENTSRPGSALSRGWIFTAVRILIEL